MKNIIILTVGMSLGLFADFIRDNTIQVVTDNSTNLQWQDDVNITKNWREAIDYCEVLTLGNKSDWRLPNVNELYFIADRNKKDPAIDSVYQNVVLNGYWSSSAYIGDESNAWIIYFNHGRSYWNIKSNSYNVRCVRDGQSS